MDIGKSFTYMFEEDKWVEKLLIGGLLMLVPIVNVFAIGYALRALKNVSEGKRPILPEWDDWGADWVKGLISSFVVPFIYALPLMFAAIPFMIVSSATTTTYGGPQYGYGNNYQTMTGLATVCSLVFSCLAALWGLLIGIVYPAGTVRYARHGQFANYFQFRELFRFIKDNLADYIVAILISIVASIVAGIVGGIACGIGVAFTSFWSSLVMAFLFGQIEAAPAQAVTADLGVPAPTYGELQTSKLDEATDEVLGGEPPKEG